MLSDILRKLEFSYIKIKVVGLRDYFKLIAWPGYVIIP